MGYGRGMPSEGVPGMRSGSGQDLASAWRFVSLIVLGLIVLAGSIFLRVADRPRDVQPMTELDLEFGTFSVGIDPGTFTDLYAYDAPTLKLTAGPGDGSIRASFEVGLYGRGGKAGKGKLVVDAPEADNFVLEPVPEDEGFDLLDHEEKPERSNQTLVLDEKSSHYGPPGREVPLSNTSAEISFAGRARHHIALEWVWRPGERLSRSGIGRKNIRIVFQFQAHSGMYIDSDGNFTGDGIHTRPLTTDPKLIHSADDVLDETLRHLVLSYIAGSGERMTAETLGAVYPAPNVVQWTHEDHREPTYYLLSVEDRRIRLWVGLLTEQTLFLAGILLGAAAGAIAANWYTIKSAANAGQTV